MEAGVDTPPPERGGTHTGRYLVWLLALAAAAGAVAAGGPEGLQRADLQLAACGAAAAALASTLRRGDARLALAALGRLRPRPGWLALAGAAALLAALQLSLPFPGQTGFEEIQTGGVAFWVLSTGQLPLEFRFTNALAAAGLGLGGLSLGALRAPFHMLGLLDLLLAALTLRRLRVAWAAALPALLLLASLRPLAVGVGSADELFSGVFPTLLLIFLLACALTSERHALAWSAAAGCVAGALLFEYIAYRAMLATAAGAAAQVALRRRPGARVAPVALLLTAELVAMPMLAQTIFAPEDSLLVEGLRRNLAEQPAGGALRPFVERNVADYAAGLFGLPSPANNAFYAIQYGPIMDWRVGLLLALGLAVALVRPGRPLVRPLALTALAMLLAAGASTSSPNIGRLTPVLAILALLAGPLAQCLLDLAGAAPGRARRPARWLAAGLVAAAGVAAAAANAAGAAEFAASPLTRAEFANDEYVVCGQVGRAAAPGQRVVLYSADRPGLCREGDTTWLTGGRAGYESVDHMPTPEELSPGTLVVVGRTHGLTDADTAQVAALAAAGGGAVQSARDIAGATTVMSLCYQCGR